VSKRTLNLTDELYDYMLSVSLRESASLQALRRETRETVEDHVMQISPDQGQFMALLAELIGARRYLEVGTFTGYSAMAMSLAMGEGSETVCCDVSETFTDIARRHWAEAGIAGRIDLRLAPAVETLDALIAEGRAGAFDMMFIDADKENYAAYYERGLQLVRTGGLIMIDNVLWGGDVINVDDRSDSTEAIRGINRTLSTDDRVSVSMIGIGDGLFLARKR